MKSPERQWTVEAHRDFYIGRFEAMASPCEVLVHTDCARTAKELTEICSEEAWRVEKKYSRYIKGNIVDQINTANGRSVRVDVETAGLIEFAFQLYQLSHQLFDISSGVLRRAWKFNGSDNVPSDDDVQALLPLIGLKHAKWQNRELTLPSSMELDFGGIGKEYAVDSAAQKVATKCEQSCLVNFGGDLRVTLPRSDGAPWLVGIDESLTQIQIKRGALATSGDANRFLLKNGQRYSHVLNPTTGWPIEQAPHSVTVLADTCTQAGMIATLASLQGVNAEQFLAEQVLDDQRIKYWVSR